MTMTKPRKPPVHSTENLARILAGAEQELAPPPHVPLSEADWPYWHSLIGEFARADWTPHMLEVAALLARTMAELEAEQRELRKEGVVYLNSRGDPATNPRTRIVATLTGRVLAYRRSLALTGRAKAGGTDNAARQRRANRDYECALRSGASNDDLLS